MRVCTACTRSTEETGRFCPDCGAALADLSVAATHPGMQGAAVAPASGVSSNASDGAAADASSASKLLGTTIDGQFKLQSILGAGSFGIVYKGTQVGLDRPVAVKVPTHEIAVEPVMARRFAREARSAARVQHPGVVSIYAVGELPDGRPYLAMEFVDGQPLDKILDAGPLPALRALRIVRSIASALSETHATGVVHRDLKPSNTMWRRDRNGDDRITLVDFGIAIAKPGNADATRLTADGLVGTPHYMSPEQAHGDQVDARADLYALGCILFELVTGTTPYEGSGFEVLLAHMGRPAPVPSERNASVPEAVDQLCAMLMAKKPDERPQNADVVVTILDQIIGDLERTSPAMASTVPATRSPRGKRPRTLATRLDLPDGTVLPRQRRARRSVMTALAALGLMGLGGGLVYVLRDHKTAVADPSDEPTMTNGSDHDPLVGRRKQLFKDNGEMIVRALVPDPLVAGQEIRARIEVRNKLGQAVVADEIVLTMADESGAAKGLTARPRRDSQQQGRYYFGYLFPHAGRYTLRVFPPSIDSSFEIPIDVQ